MRINKSSEQAQTCKDAMQRLPRGWFLALCSGLLACGGWGCSPPLVAAIWQSPDGGGDRSPSVELNLGLPPGARPVPIECAFHLEDVDEIDDEAETFEFSGVLTLVWHDPRQAFDPATAGLSEKIYQGEYQFDEIAPGWYPQITLANESGGFEIGAVTLRITPDGTCTLLQAIHATAESKLDLRKYPFDRQQLEAHLQIFGFSTSEVALRPQVDANDSARIRQIRMPQWQVDGMTLRVAEKTFLTHRGATTGSTLVLAFDVRRRSLFMLRLVVTPLLLIVVLSWSVFWMDRSTLGDRINISFIGILTSVAYQIVVGGILPQISYITWMNIFLNISFWLMCLTVVINIVVGEFDKRGKIAIGDRIDHYCRWIFPLVYFSLLAGSLLYAQWNF